MIMYNCRDAGWSSCEAAPTATGKGILRKHYPFPIGKPLKAKGLMFCQWSSLLWKLFTLTRFPHRMCEPTGKRESRSRNMREAGERWTVKAEYNNVEKWSIDILFQLTSSDTATEQKNNGVDIDFDIAGFYVVVLSGYAEIVVGTSWVLSHRI